jgi:hypothetical protein
MPVKTITNPLQAFTSGATWGTLSGDNEMTQIVANLLNGAGTTLYTGDVVAIDVTGTQAILPPGAGDLRVIGVVGGTYQDASYYPPGSANINIRPLGDGFTPPQLSAVTTASMGFTNGSGTVTYAGAAAGDLGKQLYPAYSSGNNPNPQVYTITAVSAGVNYTVTPTFNGTTGTFVTQLQLAPSAIGPGWGPSSIYPVGIQVPVVQQGYGRINVAGASTTVAGGALSSTTAGSTTFVAAGAATAAQNGTFIAVPLEAYAARDLTLTNSGIAGHETVRAWICKY